MLEAIYKNTFSSACFDRKKNLLRTQCVGIVKVEAITDLLATQLQKKVGGKLDWHAFDNIPEAERWMALQIQMHNNPSNTKAS